MGQKTKIVALLCAGALAGGLASVSLQTLARGTLAPLPLDELQQFAAVFGMIKSNYVDPVDDKKLITDAISGMVSGLDPHSAYLDKKALEGFNESSSGKFVGVGIEITQQDDYVKVVSPIEDSPAFKAGIKPNDLIVKIDDTPVNGLTLNESVKRMRGEPNSKVTLSIFRKDENRTFDVLIVRQLIQTHSIKGRIIEPGYGWLRITQFQDRTVADFVAKAQELYQQEPNLKGLVLDLRNDPGGYLDAAVAISAAFLPDNVTVVSASGQLPQSNFSYKASPQFYARGEADPLAKLDAKVRQKLRSVPLLVLVNEGSASASEIVAGALQDHRRARLLGSQTFGKGSVQTAVCLDGGYRMESCPSAGLKITTSRYYTPSGKSIQAKGIVPDLMVDETEQGDLFAVLRTREADLQKHLINNQDGELENTKLEQERDAARKKLEEEMRKPEAERKLPDFGSSDDFRLQQALKALKGEPVLLSKTQTERKEQAKDN